MMRRMAGAAFLRPLFSVRAGETVYLPCTAVKGILDDEVFITVDVDETHRLQGFMPRRDLTAAGGEFFVPALVMHSIQGANRKPPAMLARVFITENVYDGSDVLDGSLDSEQVGTVLLPVEWLVKMKLLNPAPNMARGTVNASN